MKRVFLCIVLLLISFVAFSFDKMEEAEAIAQKLALDTVKLRMYKDNILYLEDVNHQEWNLNYFNEDNSLQYINFLEDNTSDMLLTGYKKERLDYLYARNKKLAILNAIPDPLSILSIVNANNASAAAAGKGAASSKAMIFVALAGTALSSYRNYRLAKNQLDETYLKDLWELEDYQKELIDRGYKEFRNYFTKQGIPFSNSFTNDRLTNLISIIENENPVTRLARLKALEPEYGNWSYYWFSLACTAYDQEDYKQCILYCERFFEKYVKVLQLDENYSRMLIQYLSSLISTTDIESERVYELLQLIEDNLYSDDYAGKMFCSLVYYDQGFYDDAYRVLYGLCTSEIANCEKEIKKYIQGDYISQFRSSFEDQIDSINFSIKALEKEKDKTFPLAWGPIVKQITAAKLEIKNIEEIIEDYNEKLLPPPSLLMIYFSLLVSSAKQNGMYDSSEFNSLSADLAKCLWRVDDYNKYCQLLQIDKTNMQAKGAISIIEQKGEFAFRVAIPLSFILEDAPESLDDKNLQVNMFINGKETSVDEMSILYRTNKDSNYSDVFYRMTDYYIVLSSKSNNFKAEEFIDNPPIEVRITSNSPFVATETFECESIYENRDTWIKKSIDWVGDTAESIWDWIT